MPLLYSRRSGLMLLWLLLAVTTLHSQPFTREVNPFTLRSGTTELLNPFSGGNNNPETQFVDIDQDGDQDLFLLNSDGTFAFYRNNGGSAPENFTLATTQIPGLVFFQWFYFYDLDADSDLDYLTGGADNTIRYMINAGSNTMPVFATGRDTVRDAAGEPIINEGGCNPVLCDIDADLDADLILGNTVGTLSYYQNTGTTSLFRFTFISANWQNILIIGGGKSNLHGASSLDCRDLDGDGDFDLLWGDFFSKSVYYLQNTGTASNPALNLLHRVYPQNADSIGTSGFNMPRTVDIDGDGDADLFISVLYDATVPQTLLYYKNLGTPQVPNFRIAERNFLRTLDTGIESVPAFADIDADGDGDLFVGNAQNPKGTIYFLRRDGTSAAPVFTLIDTQYAGIANELSVAPAFADADGDGDPDLFTGFFDGTVGYYKNTGTPNLADFRFQGLLRDTAGTAIDAGLYARPFFLDTNGDNRPDLLLGGFNGKITRYQNRGGVGSLTFIKDDAYFSSIDVGEYAAPVLADFDRDGKMELISGSRTGDLYAFHNAGTLSNPIWEPLQGMLPGNQSGTETAAAFSDADADGDLDLFIGNIKGGLYFYRNGNLSSAKERTEQSVVSGRISIYPQPATSKMYITLPAASGKPDWLRITSMTGEVVFELSGKSVDLGTNPIVWNCRNLLGGKVSAGVYVITAGTEQGYITGKCVVTN